MMLEKNLAVESEQLQSLEALAETYEIVAATTMRRIRQSVLVNRAFHIGLNRIFSEVKKAHQKETELFIRQEQGTKKSVLGRKRKGKTILVLFSANTALYGDIIEKTFSRFVKELKSFREPPEVVVIGRLGKTFFEETFPATPFFYFESSDHGVLPDVIKKLAGQLSKHEKVLAFHGIFKNLLIQQAGMTNLSGEVAPLEKDQKDEAISYLFEPSLETIVIFFETEIFASLLEQAFHESHLSRVASRFVLMDKATINIERELVGLTFKKNIVRHRTGNRKLINSLSSFPLWKDSSVQPSHPS